MKMPIQSCLQNKVFVGFDFDALLNGSYCDTEKEYLRGEKVDLFRFGISVM